ncbi:MAG: FAD-dependent monooxygenase [Eubacteriales bacterium]|nr:FAD-dependent monooxygenase [Eubacteriales bacterium]
MIRINNIKAALDEPERSVIDREARRRGIRTPYRGKIASRAVDARKRDEIRCVYAVNYTFDGEKAFLARWRSDPSVTEEKPLYEPPARRKTTAHVLVVGAGPCGLFAAKILSDAGLRVTLIERGKCVEERAKDVEIFAQTGQLNVCSNVQFGEGGAGTFSDGKLNTGTHDPRARYVLTELVGAGAPEEILTDTKPHVGTDRLRAVVTNLRRALIERGVTVRFRTTLTDLETRGGAVKAAVLADENGEREELACDALVLAVGNSARDTFEMLYRRGAAMEQKPFSVGVRIEHLQSDVDRLRYGRFAGSLPAADYKLSTHLADGRGVYTFCMCPGGVVMGAASEAGRVVTNGMSLYARDGRNANAGFLVGVNAADFGAGDALAGMRYQREIEERSFRAGGGGYRAVAQTLGDFLDGRETVAFGKVLPTYCPGVTPGDIRAALPKPITDALAAAVGGFERQFRGWADREAVLTASETRSSSPVRILRGEDGVSAVLRGLYPCGEGAGYAGGIVSAAVDGIRTAEKVIERIGKEN